jgi:hypothetical protein
MLRKNELYSLLRQKKVSNQTISLTQKEGERTNIDIRITQYVEATTKENILRSREKVKKTTENPTPRIRLVFHSALNDPSFAYLPFTDYVSSTESESKEPYILLSKPITKTPSPVIEQVESLDGKRRKRNSILQQNLLLKQSKIMKNSNTKHCLSSF